MKRKPAWLQGLAVSGLTQVNFIFSGMFKKSFAKFIFKEKG